MKTNNFTHVISDAVVSMDYNSKLKIIEIEFTPGTVYHYLKMNKYVWTTLLKHAEKGEGLGIYINQYFKKMVHDESHDYYELMDI